MAEENNQPIAENPSEPEKEDNRLPYEKPELRKHGKVNDTTFTRIFPGRSIDVPFRPGRDRS